MALYRGYRSDDGDGYFFIVDRKKDLVIIGGLKVYPREIEEVLHEHPKVREAVVVGVSTASEENNSSPRWSSRMAQPTMSARSAAKAASVERPMGLQ